MSRYQAFTAFSSMGEHPHSAGTGLRSFTTWVVELAAKWLSRKVALLSAYRRTALRNENYTRATTGVAGLLLAEIFGRPSYANYHIQLVDGRLVQVASKELFEVDACVAAKLPALSAERGYAELG
jgi:hypothetical protein